jgi:hypothetical protein
VGGQGEEETDFEEPYDGLEIAEQTALDHFNAILQKAQILATKAEKDKPRKRPRRYSGKSQRTLKRQKDRREALAKQGQLSLFGYMSYMKNKAMEKKPLEQPMTRTSEGEQISESESDSDVEVLVSERVDQVRPGSS